MSEQSAGGDGLGRSKVIFALWTGVSRVAGLVREIVAAAIFGHRGVMGAFTVAFAVPNLLRSLVADSALTAAFIPVLTELRESGRQREGDRLIGALVSLIALALGALTILAIIVAPWVMPLFAPSLPDQYVDDLVFLSQLMFPIVVLLALTGVAMALLQMAGQFGPTAFAPVLWNALIILSLLAITPLFSGDDRIIAYAIGILIGTLGQLLFLVPWLARLNQLRPRLGLRSPHLRTVLILMLPVTIGLGLINLNLIVDFWFATRAEGDAGPRPIEAAFRLYLLPQGIFSVAVATVLFPTIARMAARGDAAGMREAVGTGLRQIFLMLLPASAFLLVLAEPVTRLVYERGDWTAAGTALTADALFYFTIGLAFNGASLLLIRAFFSLQEPWIPTWIAVGAAVLNLVLDAILFRPLGLGGITLATSLVSIATFLALLVMLAPRMGGLRVGWLIDGALRALGASVVSGLAALAVWAVVDDAAGRDLIGQVASTGAALVAAVIAFLIAAWALRLPERELLRQYLRPLR